jgi:methyl-accepting chemotaxis protein
MAATSNQAQAQRARRRTFLVDRGFQLKWTLIIVAVGVLVSAGLGYFIVQLNLANTELLELDAAFAEQVAEYDAMAIYYLVGFVVVMALALFIWGIFMTHRVAGPIYIISRYLGQLADGQVPQTRPLRRGDELKTFFDTFSAAVESLRRENLAEVELLQQAAAALDQQQGQAELAESLRQLAADKKKWEQETD